MRQVLVAGAIGVVALMGCTDPGRTTGMGAAAGGVIGGGLGAIVGNQTGNPASGFVVGATAGAASGALVGNALEAQGKAIGTQDEMIDRQERELAAQRAEMEELRRMSQDQVSYRDKPTATTSADVNVLERAQVSPTFMGIKTGGGLAPEAGAIEQEPVAPKRLAAELTPACREAQQEVTSAEQAVEVADQLFHFRRALRLCPTEPAFHVGLGRIYVSLNRIEDAEYEFQEALKLDSQYEAARQALQELPR